MNIRAGAFIAIVLAVPHLAIVLAVPHLALAQDGGFSLSIDPSIRSAGMGNATATVFWGQDPNYWTNPALLGYHEGIRVEWGKTQFVPDLADDVYFKSNRLTLGAWGAALAFSLAPHRLEYGVSEAIDVDGNLIGTFESYEDLDARGVALNVVEFTENILGRFRSGVPPIARYGDVSVGYMRTNISVFLAPAQVLPDPFSSGVQGEANTNDFGLFLRATPWNTIDHPIASLRKAPGFRLDLNLARSWRNYGEAQLEFGPNQSDTLPEDTRRGFSFRIAASFPESTREDLVDGGFAWLPALITPLVSFGKAWDRSEDGFGRTHHRDGWELTLLNVFSLRGGELDGPPGDIRGSSSGWSIGLQFANVAGFRWDKATYPQASGLRDLERNGFTAFVDAIALTALVREE